MARSPVQSRTSAPCRETDSRQNDRLNTVVIIGITGTAGAGKGETAKYLIKKGFGYHSARLFIIEEIKRRDLHVDRDSMIAVANDLRREHDPVYIIQRLYEDASKSGGDQVIESVRTKGEIDYLRKDQNFILLGIDADRASRYDRIRKRGSESDMVSFEKFSQQEMAESVSEDPGVQNLPVCIKKADFVICNNGSIADLHSKIDEVLKNVR